MSDHYGLPELRQFISGKTHLDTNPLLQEPLSIHCCLGSSTAPPPNSYEHVIAGDVFSNGFAQFPLQDYSSGINSNITTTASDAFCSIEEAEKGWHGFDTGNNRWPRQETLSLLDIRSRLDSKFRETNQKGPLWNEVSRIMDEEYGYQRSGKKCKEKFENLYKYYKKTRDGRQDGKHYRFFHQLEAICGETSSTHPSTSSETLTNNNHGGNTNIAPFNQTSSITINKDPYSLYNLKCSKSRSFSYSSELFETSSCENNDEDLSTIAYMMKQSRNEKKKGLDQRETQGRRRRSWKAKVEELVDTHMRKLIETQETWMQKLFSVIDHREQEMAYKEEERMSESIRFDREVHELWAEEIARVESRDAALMEVVKKNIGKGVPEAILPLAEPFIGEEPQNFNENKSHRAYPCEAGENSSNNNRWTELEISNLIQLRTGFELRFKESGVWDVIAAKMACLGFDRSANECKQIWDEVSYSLSKAWPFE